MVQCGSEFFAVRSILSDGQTDKLVAVRGLARQLEERRAQWEARAVRSAFEVLFPAASALEIYFHYKPGIRLSDICRGLLWRADGGVQRQDLSLGFPSWSWAAIETPVIYPPWAIDQSPREMPEILSTLRLPRTQTDDPDIPLLALFYFAISLQQLIY